MKRSNGACDDQRVVLVIPDAGPLISLGKAKHLEILLKLELPIYIVWFWFQRSSVGMHL